MAKKKCNLPVVEDINKYELQMERREGTGNPVPVKNTYVDKKSGEVVKIDWRDGAFRLL